MEGAKWKEHMVKLYSTFYDQNYLLQCYSLPKEFSWFGRAIFQKCQVFSETGCKIKHIENVINNKIPFIIMPQNVDYLEKIQQKSVYDF